MKIKGEYIFTIPFQNMFNDKSMNIKGHNLVTDEGVNMIMGCLNGSSNNVFGDVHVGTGQTTPSLTDTLKDFNDFKALNNELDASTETKRTVEGGVLTYNIITDGGNLNNTTEIGVWSSEGDVLISHDLHDPFNVPSGSLITLEYKFTLTNNYD